MAAASPLTAVPLLLRDSPVLAVGSFEGRQNRQVRVQVTSVTSVAHTSSTVTGIVTDGYLPIEEGDAVVFQVQGDDDLNDMQFTISAVVSQNTVTGQVVFTVLVDSIVNGNIAGYGLITPAPAGGSGGSNFAAWAVQEGCKGISWDVTGISGGSLQLEGALNVDGPWSIIGTAVTQDGTQIATLPVGVRFVRLTFNSGGSGVVAWISCF